MPTRNLAIMFTDIKGFTARTSEQTRDEVVRLLSEHERLMRPVFRHFGGNVVKTIGDAFLVTFESPTDAVLCGLTVQEVLRRYNASASAGTRLDVRVAINVGEVELRDGDIFGEPVNVAARLEGITDAGEVYFTESVYLTMNRHEAPSTEVGERTFKGIPHPVRVYKVLRDPNSEQLRRIAESVELSPEGPRIRSLGEASRPTAPAQKFHTPSNPSKAGKIALLSALIGGAVLAALAFPFLPSRAAQAQASRHLRERRPLEAYRVADARLQQGVDEPHLRELAGGGAAAYVDQLGRDGKHEEALAWAQEQLKTRTYLKPLEEKVPALDAKVNVPKLLAARPRNYDRIWEEIRGMLKRYPADAEVPWTIAREVEKDLIFEVTLWLDHKSMERGPAHRGDAHVYENVVKTLERNPPDSSYAEDAHALMKAYYPQRRVEWAQQAVKSGSGNALFNAWGVLEETKDPLAQDAFLKALRDVMAAQDVSAALTEVTRGAQNPEHVQRAQRVLQDALESHRLKDEDAARVTKVVEGLRQPS